MPAGPSLSASTSLRVGGPAGRIERIADGETLAAALARVPERGPESLLLLGGGTNVVISDTGFPETVLMLGGGEISVRDEAPDAIEFSVDAGVVWDDLVERSTALGATGLEMMSGIPGLVGAAPVQNIAAYGQQVCDAITAVDVIDRATLSGATFATAECGFGFRTSRFKTDWRDRYVIARVHFRVPLGPAQRASTYVDIEKYFERNGGDAYDVADRRRAVLATRRAKSMVLDPADPNARSAGSFFVNPTVPVTMARALAEQFRTAGMRVQYLEGLDDGPEDVQRIPAAHLLRYSGFSPGDRWSKVSLSEKHVLAIVTSEGATATDVWMVANHIRRKVKAETGVALAYEPQFVGPFPPFDPAEFDRAFHYEHGAAAEPEWLAGYR